MTSSSGKIRILYLITGLDIGGAERLLLSTLSKIREDKFDVSVCYLKGKGELKSEFENIGVRVFSLDRSLFSYAGKAFQLYRLLRNGEYDILHMHLIHAVIIGRIVGSLASVPILISTEHNTSNWKINNPLASFLYRKTEHLSCKTLAISEAVKKCLIEIANIPSNKILVLYNGIELLSFHPDHDSEKLRNELNLGNSFPIIGSTSRLDERKGLQYLIRAGSILKERFPHLSLVFIGDGKERKILEEVATTVGMKEQTIFTGTKKNVVDYLALFDIFVLPSLFEGLSVSLLEAMAMKKAIVATNVDGIPEVITHGEEGILVEPKNEESLARSIQYLIEHSEEAERMRTAARKKVETTYNIEYITRNLENIYVTLLNNYSRN